MFKGSLQSEGLLGLCKKCSTDTTPAGRCVEGDPCVASRVLRTKPGKTLDPSGYGFELGRLGLQLVGAQGLGLQGLGTLNPKPLNPKP